MKTIVLISDVALGYEKAIPVADTKVGSVTVTEIISVMPDISTSQVDGISIKKDSVRTTQ